MISVALAGSTKYTASCAAALSNSEQFLITTIITPSAKPAGRKKILEENPLANFAKQANIPTVVITEKITNETKAALEKQPQPDFLLVVDFGYWIPSWLQAWPKVKSLNIHPSALPRWRGSSPGQFVLLNGETESAVSLIEVISDMDAGNIYWQKPFAVESTWTQTEYYDHAFALIADELPTLLERIKSGVLKPTPQPKDSPTPLARKLTKADGFLAWETIKDSMENLPAAIQTAARAYSPWPQLWTEVPTGKGPTRMKILPNNQVQLAGQNPATWNQVKNAILE
ncbi:MAG: formyltransferase family protein [bacterium]|nr:formyltransferase family protein [bacterium]